MSKFQWKLREILRDLEVLVTVEGDDAGVVVVSPQELGCKLLDLHEKLRLLENEMQTSVDT